MSNIQELIDTADRLCQNIDTTIENDKKYCDDVLMELERISWSMLRMRNDLMTIKQWEGA
jgi:hypothetical protein